MAMEGLKDSLRDQWKAISGRIRESDAYSQLNDRYNSLSPAGQKLSLIGGSLVAFLIVMALPYSFYAASQSSVEEFEIKRSLVRELFRVNREASSLPPAPAPISSGELQNIARGSLNVARLQPDQISSVTELPANLPGIAKTIEQTGVMVSLSKLNLKQIVDVGHSLQSMQGTARMTGLEIKASVADSKYYDVVYKIISFAAKPEAVAPSKGRGKK